MNAILICGGRGQRALSYKGDLPKELLPFRYFHKTPIIFAIIDSILPFVQDLIICCGEDKKDLFQTVFDKYNCSAHHIIWSQDKNLGILYAFKKAAKISKDNNLVCFCDSWTDSLAWFAKFCLASSPEGILMLTEKIKYEHRLQYGCIMNNQYYDKSPKTVSVPDRSFGMFYANKNVKVSNDIHELHDLYNELLQNKLMSSIIGKSKRCYDVGNVTAWKKNIVCKKS